MGNHTATRARGRSSGANAPRSYERMDDLHEYAAQALRGTGVFSYTSYALSGGHYVHAVQRPEGGGERNWHLTTRAQVDRLVAQLAREKAAGLSAREAVRQQQMAQERAAWKEAIPSIRASVERARSAPEAVMRAPRSETRLHDAKALREEEARLRPQIQRLEAELRPLREARIRANDGRSYSTHSPEERAVEERLHPLQDRLNRISDALGGTKGDKNREKTTSALARLSPTDKQAADAQRRRDRLNSTEGMQARHEMHVLAVELELARAQVNAATPGTAAYTKARANAAAIGARVNANGQRYRDIESGKIKVGPPRTEPMTFTGKASGTSRKASGARAEGTARISVRAHAFRGQDGFLISGRDGSNRQISIFTQSRSEAERMRDDIKAGREPRFDAQKAAS